MNVLALEIVSAPERTVSLRLPQPGRFRAQVKMMWEPAEPDRSAIFEEVRRRGGPDDLALLECLGEDAM